MLDGLCKRLLEAASSSVASPDDRDSAGGEPLGFCLPQHFFPFFSLSLSLSLSLLLLFHSANITTVFQLFLSSSL